MKVEYEKWIENNVLDPTGGCAEITAKMEKEFSELTRVRGFYFCEVWGEREHWWLVDNFGRIVDPTAGQFPSKGMGEYIQWDESREEPTGKCLNCGEYTFSGRQCCDNFCEKSFKASLFK